MSLRTFALAAFGGGFLLLAPALAQSSHWAVDDATPDALLSTSTVDASFLLGALGNDFHFVGKGELIETADASARLRGVVARASHPEDRFEVDLHLGGYLKPGMYGYSYLAQPC